MITVQQAEELILQETRDFGVEIVLFDEASGRVLAENIKADRDLPAFNRVTMDGIAINYQAVANGITTFRIKATQAAGVAPIEITELNECIEIMTGAAMPGSVDTVIRYEDVAIEDDKATLLITGIKKGQNLHLKGADKKQGENILVPGQLITPAVISLVASVGETELRVKRLPRVIILSSGDELVDVNATPAPYQIRRSNSYMLQAVVAQQGIKAAVKHIPDDPEIIRQQLGLCLQNFDVILLSGGISAGKFDYIPQALADLQVDQVFHKVLQRPGKPFWFGKHHNGVVVFAFPGNPVATFLGVQRYFIPWLKASLGLAPSKTVYAVLDEDITFRPPLEYFLQVRLLINEQGRLLAIPVEGNGSGDFANLADTDAFMQLPLAKSEFKKGEVYQVWLFV
ncbi:molybdopterin molybdotransferase MoeA [Mucilaginibacter sp. UR6-11]|uniref:molybdopterin molybdotransferase MoeA n=1 Tax=Mucilaginibacter sp. UR6-11 TaxID=1435644 RepID=UPI001E53F23A|nr:molybdopterin molybdotransferase MoeA [Mucilaginibacter sp. UR6-11]MCC8426283.1 molybdopterin molybdotransferase MoeA [Mucilaginibacter sp. UR6-11]